jgi:hypothetical protein
MKLTLVSISVHGKKLSLFVNLPVTDGKVHCSMDIINGMLILMGCSSQGATYTIG